MATKIFLITTANKVYGTYYKTICFEQSFTNEDEKSEAKLYAGAALFFYAATFGSVFVEDFETTKQLTENDIFDFLSEKHQD
jgi:hypothetical protein